MDMRDIFEGYSKQEKERLMAFCFRMEMDHWKSFENIERQLNRLSLVLEDHFSRFSPSQQLKDILSPEEMELYHWRWEQYRQQAIPDDVTPAIFSLSKAREDTGFQKHCLQELGYFPGEGPDSG